MLARSTEKVVVSSPELPVLKVTVGESDVEEEDAMESPWCFLTRSRPVTTVVAVVDASSMISIAEDLFVKMVVKLVRSARSLLYMHLLGLFIVLYCSVAVFNERVTSAD